MRNKIKIVTLAGLGSPVKWLPDLNPGGGIPNGDISYVAGVLAPFLVRLFVFALVMISLVMLLTGGIMWITGKGEKEPMAKAKATVTYAIIGLAIGLGSFIIVNIIGGFFNFNPFVF